MRRSAVLGLVITGVALAWGASAIASEHTTFPGPGISTDPTRRWVIEWKEPTQQTAHLLFLKDLRTGQVVQLYEFDRSVDVLWAPDGKAVAITDHAASDESVVHVIRPEQPRSPIDVEKALVGSLGRIHSLYENGHRYFEAQKWLTSSRLRFGVRAHDARPGVEYKALFVFDLLSGGVLQVGAQ